MILKTHIINPEKNFMEITILNHRIKILLLLNLANTHKTRI